MWTEIASIFFNQSLRLLKHWRKDGKENFHPLRAVFHLHILIFLWWNK